MNLQHAITQFDTLSTQEKRAFSHQVRERYLKALSETPSEGELHLLRRALAYVIPTQTTTIDGLTLSSHPTTSHSMARFVEADRLNTTQRKHFAQPTASQTTYLVAFADPQTLHFRTFECILPLDRCFESTQLSFTPDKAQALLPEQVYSVAMRPCPSTSEALKRLDTLGLYVPPINANTRGGKRFIFHSASLADSLTTALLQTLPETLLENFVHVNPVFRCNRFTPDDQPFDEHIDTPYADLARHHVSKYTLLLYLSGGSGPKPLSFQDKITIDNIEEMTCIIFHQALTHEGRPFKEDNKIFLRSELIFEERAHTHDEDMARLFSTACYMTGESMFFPQLEAYANDCYNRVATGHWEGLSTKGHEQLYLHKAYQRWDDEECHFLTNGTDYWFSAEQVTLEACAVLALCDYFNVRLPIDNNIYPRFEAHIDDPEFDFENASFRQHCKTQIIESLQTVEHITTFLSKQVQKPTAPFVHVLDLDDLFPPPDQANEHGCPSCMDGPFQPERHAWIADSCREGQEASRKELSGAPIILMGDEITLQKEHFIVEKDKIHILSETRIAPVHFAGMTCCDFFADRSDEYVGVDLLLDGLYPLVPPILWRKTRGSFHLMFDFWRNTWMVSATQRKIPTPSIDRKQKSYLDFKSKLNSGKHNEEELKGSFCDPSSSRTG